VPAPKSKAKLERKRKHDEIEFSSKEKRAIKKVKKDLDEELNLQKVKSVFSQFPPWEKVFRQVIKAQDGNPKSMALDDFKRLVMNDIISEIQPQLDFAFEARILHSKRVTVDKDVVFGKKGKDAKKEKKRLKTASA